MDEMVGFTNTVNGRVRASSLGVVLPHEHVLCNWSNWLMEPRRERLRRLRNAPVCLENLGAIRRNPHSSLDNLTFADEGLMTEELTLLREAGGNTIVELTLTGVGRDPLGCARIARNSGVNIICGTGFYTRSSHPPEIAAMAIDEITDMIVKELVEGIGDTGIRAGVIGEIGTSHPIHSDEEKVLRAATRAQRKTGAPVWVHLDGWERWGHRVLDIVEDEGGDCSRVVMCHLDHHPDWVEYQRSLADRGAFIEYDTFGIEWTNDDRREHERDAHFVPPMPSDMERIRGLQKLLDAGYAGKLLISQDVSVKLHLVRYGGYGYAHILENMIPLMSAVGIERKDIALITERNPQEILAWVAPK